MRERQKMTTVFSARILTSEFVNPRKGTRQATSHTHDQHTTYEVDENKHDVQTT